MKPLPIIAGVGVVIVVLVGFAVFLFATGGDDGGQAESTLQEPVENGQAADGRASIDTGAVSSGTEPDPQEDPSPGQRQGGITVSPVTNRPGGPATGEFVPDIPQQQGEAPQHSWQADGLTDLESEVAGHLTEINSIAPQAGIALAAADWLADEITTLDEGIAVPLIKDMAASDPELALAVVNLPWLADDQLEGEELAVLVRLGDIAFAQPDLARSLADSPLLAGEISLEQEATVAIVQGVAAEDPELAQRMAESPELSDGIDGRELAAFTGSERYFLEQIEEQSPLTADILKSYAWVSGRTSRSLDTNVYSSPGMLASPLPQEEDSQRYQQYVLGNLVELARLDSELGQLVAGYSWLADGVTLLEVRIPWTLLFVARNDIEAARRVAGFPWMAEQPTWDHLVANHQVWRLTEYLPAQADILINQGWFQDGISDEEGALLSVLAMGCNYESYCMQLIEGGDVESKALARPTGDVKVFAVSRTPLAETAEFIFDGTQLTIDGAEELMGPSWPNSRVVVYLEPEFQYVSETRGLFAGDFVMISDSHPGRTESWDVLFHELGHHYKYATPAAWVNEGVNSFLDSYIFFAAGVGTIKDRYDRAQQSVEVACIPEGQSNIHERIQATKDWSFSEWLWKRGCDYYLGERLMHALYMDLGHDMVADSMQELYNVRAQRKRLTEGEVYEIFLSHAPPDKRQLFRDLYTCFHGMPIAGEIPSPDADCENLPLGPGTDVRDPTLLVEELAPKPQPTPTRPAQVLDDRNTLLAINEAIDNVLPWEEADQMNLPLSAWKGVFFTDEVGNVTGLNISGVKINGPMPPEIGNLAHLEWLTMTNVGLTGPLPPELGNLRNLTKLELASNQITGPLPPELGNLVNLQELDMLGNELDGSLPPELGNLTSLTYLDFTQNKLTGPIPSEIGNLTALDKLLLGNNQLTGSLPPEVGNLVNLTALNVGTNQLSGEIPGTLANLVNLNALILLDFSGNEYTGCIPAGLPDAQLSDVDRIELPGC